MVSKFIDASTMKIEAHAGCARRMRRLSRRLAQGRVRENAANVGLPRGKEVFVG
jgi:hypothetical protein